MFIVGERKDFECPPSRRVFYLYPQQSDVTELLFAADSQVAQKSETELFLRTRWWLFILMIYALSAAIFQQQLEHRNGHVILVFICITFDV